MSCAMAATSVASRAGAPPFAQQLHEERFSRANTCCYARAGSFMGNYPRRKLSQKLQGNCVQTVFGTSGNVAFKHVSRSFSRRDSVRAAVASGSENGSSEDGNVKEFLDEESFKKHLEDAGDNLVVVDISTKTCGPCKMIYPKVVEMSEKYTDAVFLKIQGDTDNSTRALMRAWGIRSVPCFRFYRKGELIHSHTGGKVDQLYEEFEKHYASANV